MPPVPAKPVKTVTDDGSGSTDLWIPKELRPVARLFIGEEWPSGSERAMRQLAAVYDDLHASLTGMEAEIDMVRAGLRNAGQGPALESALKYLASLTAEHPGYLPNMRKSAKGTADFARKIALEIEYAKYMVVLLAAWLAWQIAQAMAALVSSLGTSAAMVPIATQIAQITWKNVLIRLITSVGMGIAFNVGMDLITQGIQWLKGDRTEFDDKKFKNALKAGAIGGAVGFGLGTYIDKFLPKLSNNFFVKVFSEAAGETVPELALSEDGKWSDDATFGLTSGGTEGVLEWLTNKFGKKGPGHIGTGGTGDLGTLDPLGAAPPPPDFKFDDKNPLVDPGGFKFDAPPPPYQADVSPPPYQATTPPPPYQETAPADGAPNTQPANQNTGTPGAVPANQPAFGEQNIPLTAQQPDTNPVVAPQNVGATNPFLAQQPGGQPNTSPVTAPQNGGQATTNPFTAPQDGGQATTNPFTAPQNGSQTTTNPFNGAPPQIGGDQAPPIVTDVTTEPNGTRIVTTEDPNSGAVIVTNIDPGGTSITATTVEPSSTHSITMVQDTSTGETITTSRDTAAGTETTLVFRPGADGGTVTVSSIDLATQETVAPEQTIPFSEVPQDTEGTVLISNITDPATGDKVLTAVNPNQGVVMTGRVDAANPGAFSTTLVEPGVGVILVGRDSAAGQMFTAKAPDALTGNGQQNGKKSTDATATQNTTTDRGTETETTSGDTTAQSEGVSGLEVTVVEAPSTSSDTTVLSPGAQSGQTTGTTTNTSPNIASQSTPSRQSGLDGVAGTTTAAPNTQSATLSLDSTAGATATTSTSSADSSVAAPSTAPGSIAGVERVLANATTVDSGVVLSSDVTDVSFASKMAMVPGQSLLFLHNSPTNGPIITTGTTNSIAVDIPAISGALSTMDTLQPEATAIACYFGLPGVDGTPSPAEQLLASTPSLTTLTAPNGNVITTTTGDTFIADVTVNSDGTMTLAEDPDAAWTTFTRNSDGTIVANAHPGAFPPHATPTNADTHLTDLITTTNTAPTSAQTANVWGPKKDTGKGTTPTATSTGQASVALVQTFALDEANRLTGNNTAVQVSVVDVLAPLSPTPSWALMNQTREYLAANGFTNVTVPQIDIGYAGFIAADVQLIVDTAVQLGPGFNLTQLETQLPVNPSQRQPLMDVLDWQGLTYAGPSTAATTTTATTTTATTAGPSTAPTTVSTASSAVPTVDTVTGRPLARSTTDAPAKKSKKGKEKDDDSKDEKQKVKGGLQGPLRDFLIGSPQLNDALSIFADYKRGTMPDKITEAVVTKFNSEQKLWEQIDATRRGNDAKAEVKGLIELLTTELDGLDPSSKKALAVRRKLVNAQLGLAAMQQPTTSPAQRNQFDDTMATDRKKTKSDGLRKLKIQRNHLLADSMIHPIVTSSVYAGRKMILDAMNAATDDATRQAARTTAENAIANAFAEFANVMNFDTSYVLPQRDRPSTADLNSLLAADLTTIQTLADRIGGTAPLSTSEQQQLKELAELYGFGHAPETDFTPWTPQKMTKEAANLLNKLQTEGVTTPSDGNLTALRNKLRNAQTRVEQESPAAKFRQALNTGLGKKESEKLIKDIAETMSQNSHNLRMGDASTNASIGFHFDPELVPPATEPYLTSQFQQDTRQFAPRSQEVVDAVRKLQREGLIPSELSTMATTPARNDTGIRSSSGIDGVQESTNRNAGTTATRNPALFTAPAPHIELPVHTDQQQLSNHTPAFPGWLVINATYNSTARTITLPGLNADAAGFAGWLLDQGWNGQPIVLVGNGFGGTDSFAAQVTGILDTAIVASPHNVTLRNGVVQAIIPTIGPYRPSGAAWVLHLPDATGNTTLQPINTGFLVDAMGDLGFRPGVPTPFQAPDLATPRYPAPGTDAVTSPMSDTMQATSSVTSSISKMSISSGSTGSSGYRDLSSPWSPMSIGSSTKSPFPPEAYEVIHPDYFATASDPSASTTAQDTTVPDPSDTLTGPQFSLNNAARTVPPVVVNLTPGTKNTAYPQATQAALNAFADQVASLIEQARANHQADPNVSLEIPASANPGTGRDFRKTLSKTVAKPLGNIFTGQSPNDIFTQTSNALDQALYSHGLNLTAQDILQAATYLHPDGSTSGPSGTTAPDPTATLPTTATITVRPPEMTLAEVRNNQRTETDSTITTGRRIIFGAAMQHLDFARAVPIMPNTTVIFAEGHDGRLTINGQPVAPETLAEALATPSAEDPTATGVQTGDRLLFVVCEAGRGIAIDVADALAERHGIFVGRSDGANGDVYTNRGGHIRTSPSSVPTTTPTTATTGWQTITYTLPSTGGVYTRNITTESAASAPNYTAPGTSETKTPKWAKWHDGSSPHSGTYTSSLSTEALNATTNPTEFTKSLTPDAAPGEILSPGTNLPNATTDSVSTTPAESTPTESTATTTTTPAEAVTDQSETAEEPGTSRRGGGTGSESPTSGPGSTGGPLVLTGTEQMPANITPVDAGLVLSSDPTDVSFASKVAPVPGQTLFFLHNNTTNGAADIPAVSGTLSATGSLQPAATAMACYFGLPGLDGAPSPAEQLLAATPELTTLTAPSGTLVTTTTGDAFIANVAVSDDGTMTLSEDPDAAWTTYTRNPNGTITAITHPGAFPPHATPANAESHLTDLITTINTAGSGESGAQVWSHPDQVRAAPTGPTASPTTPSEPATPSMADILNGNATPEPAPATSTSGVLDAIAAAAAKFPTIPGPLRPHGRGAGDETDYEEERRRMRTPLLRPPASPDLTDTAPPESDPS